MYLDDEPKNFRGITAFNSESNPRIIVARLAGEKGLAVGVSDAIDIEGKRHPNVAAIYVHPKDEPLFRSILYSAEIMAFPTDYNSETPTSFDEKHYWCNVYNNYVAKADREWRSRNYIKAVQYDVRAIGAWARFEMVADGELSFLKATFNPLLKTTAEIRELVEQVVDRELASNR